jgi:hypothetical protein
MSLKDILLKTRLFAARGDARKMPLRQHIRRSVLIAGGLLCLGLGLLPGCSPVAMAQSGQAATAQDTGSAGTAAQSDTPHSTTVQDSGSTAPGSQQPMPKGTGSIEGTVADQDGALAVGATISLTHPGKPGSQQVQSGDNGQFSFSSQPSGPFQLLITASGFQSKIVSGALQPGQAYIVPEITINVAATTTDVKVGLSPDEVAEVEVKEQEKQRVLGFIPNFYASYIPDAAPLPSKLKFQLAWKSVTDPISIVGAGFLAGIYQASDQLNGYGQGAAGYGKRFGAVYGDVFIGTFIDSAILPSVFHQDPRYFYRGPDASGSRFMYAIGNAVICKGDNKKYGVNYSAIVGSFITSGISQTYYPASDRGTGLYFQTALIRIAEGSVAGIFQEYVVKHLTPHLKKDDQTQP